MNRRRVGLTLLLPLLGGLAYLATGLVVVRSGEHAVVRRLGRVLPTGLGPGLHLGLPAGFDQVDRVRTDEVRRLAIGPSGAPGVWDDPGAGEFLTGDLNLVRAEATVQYRVADPSAFALRSRDVESILRRVAEASLCRALARQGIDATLREGRSVAAREAERALGLAAERYGLGVAVLSVSLTEARPPSEVAAEFAAAQAAGSDRDRRINEAKTRAATTVTEARASASVRLEQARGAADRTLALARARVARFLAVLDSTTAARGPSVRRLYHEMLRELLPKVGRKLVLAPEEPVDLSILGGR